MRTLIVTCALPYANGPFHLGHILEYIQADIWARFQRMQGHRVLFVSADDTHGTPIMIAAEKAGITPQEYVGRIAAGRQAYFDGFQIGFDHWYSSDGPENHALAQEFFRTLRGAGLIAEREVEQFYDPVKGMFLPDRYVKGGCPRCGAADQYGDSCEVCSAVYRPTELISPYSVLSGAAPERRTSTHFFFRLSAPEVSEFIGHWLREGKMQSSVANKMGEWLHTGLQDWDITRDAPYFGIEVPDAPGKYFYVWLDAPIGYLATLQHCFESGKAQALIGETRAFEDFFADPSVELHHFIGKDITYFHCLFWPALLRFTSRRLPSSVHAHGFITMRSAKMSKSRGTAIDPLQYLRDGHSPDWLRYFFAAKLGHEVSDLDFRVDDFVERVNADLIGKFVNIVSRIAKPLTDKLGGETTDRLDQEGSALVAKLRAESPVVMAHYEQREFDRVVRSVMALADMVNEYIARVQPWVLAKQPDQQERLRQVCSTALDAFRVLSIYLQPIVPSLAADIAQYLGDETYRFADAQEPLGQRRLGTYRHLMGRADAEKLETLLDGAGGGASA